MADTAISDWIRMGQDHNMLIVSSPPKMPEEWPINNRSPG